jgi:hypothetical protein
MEVYNCEEQNGKVILCLEKKEAQTLNDICGAATEANKKKRSFKTFKDKLEKQMSCY